MQYTWEVMDVAGFTGIVAKRDNHFVSIDGNTRSMSFINTGEQKQFDEFFEMTDFLNGNGWVPAVKFLKMSELI
jgi:hypothetical protein